MSAMSSILFIVAILLYSSTKVSGLEDKDSCSTGDNGSCKDNISFHNEFIQEEFGRQSKSFYEAAKVYKDDNLTPLIDAADIRETHTILDLACGPGLITTECAKRNPKKVIGIDITLEMLDIAQKHAMEHGFNTDDNKDKTIEFIHGNVENLPFEDNTFDIVITRWTFHHFDQLQTVIHEIHRVLKPTTGKLVFLEFSAPNNTDDGMVEVFNAMHTIRDPSHVWAYNEQQWIEQIHKGGFNMDNIEIIGRRSAKMNWMEFIEWTNPSQKDMRARKSIHTIGTFLKNCNCDVGMNFHYDDDHELMIESKYIIVRAIKG